MYVYLKHIHNSALRGRDLVKHILTFSRKEDSELTIVQFHQAIKEVLELIKPTMPSNIKIRSNIDKNSGGVMADLAQIHQIFINLCINAEHAMRKEGGTLEVNLESVRLDARISATHNGLEEGDYLKLSVSDTGHGMSKKVMEQIFQPFFSTKIAEEGTGLGLATVHGIVSSLGGDIIAKSEPEMGTTFVVYLPEIKNIVTEKKPHSIEIPGGSERILYVDDEEDIVGSVQEMLENLGYEVITKTNSLEALEIFKNDPQKFDLVITDQTMPDMTGDVLARKILQIRPEIPVTLCTGFSHTITAEKAKALGIQEFIMKPFVTTHFANTVRKVLDQNKKNK
jgi:CheY-like chemotaxis protein